MTTATVTPLHPAEAFLDATAADEPEDVMATLISMLSATIQIEAEQQDCPDCATGELFDCAVRMLADDLGMVAVDEDGVAVENERMN